MVEGEREILRELRGGERGVVEGGEFAANGEHLRLLIDPRSDAESSPSRAGELP
jgi:hypothetical protein